MITSVTRTKACFIQFKNEEIINVKITFWKLDYRALRLFWSVLAGECILKFSNMISHENRTLSKPNKIIILKTRKQ